MPRSGGGGGRRRGGKGAGGGGKGGVPSSDEPDEAFRIEALKALKQFRETDIESIEFPASLHNRERAFVHKHCKLLGLNSKSHGTGEARRLVVTRKSVVGNVVVVSGETGTGKSTQVPQFILDDPGMGPTANIVVTQPRRLAATSLAERVAFERGEAVGRSVGYNVRLDSATSSATRLLFCTTGVILRRVTSDPSLRGVSHLIIDEAHERDVNSDFLLAILRDVLPLRPDLRVVIMSATIHLQLFVDFFSRRVPEGAAAEAPRAAGAAAAPPAAASAAARGDGEGLPPALARPRCVFISGTTHRVTRFFLADVLEQTGFLDNRGGGRGRGGGAAAPPALGGDGNPLELAALLDDGAGYETADPASFFECPSCQAFGFVDVDEYAEHAATCMGPDNPGTGGRPAAERAAAGGGKKPAGLAGGDAEAGAVGPDDEDAAAAPDDGVAASFFDPVAAAGAAAAAAAGGAAAAHPAVDGSKPVAGGVNTLALPVGVRGRSGESAEEGTHPLLAEYQRKRGDDDDRVDARLVAALVKHIYINTGPQSALWRKTKDRDGGEMGAVLVFLPGWEDISAVRSALQADAILGNESRAQILALHSAVPGKEQRRVFQRPPPGVMKVVLSTNIAETSLTIDDVVYVIDSGMHKQKGHDAYTGMSSLATKWVSKAAARQRAGRAGRVRPGICYHLFSSMRHEGMQDFETPEILRTPLDELCLQVKLLQRQWSIDSRSAAKHSLEHLREGASAAAFLQRSLEPPPELAVDAALQLLADIGAIDIASKPSGGTAESLTALGEALAQLPLPPRLGKMILHGVLLRCVDPVVTIACAVSYRTPFVLPMSAADKAAADKAKVDLAHGLPSDHMALLGAWEGYSKAERTGGGFGFCRRWFLSPSVMRMVGGIRRQLLRELEHAGVVTRAQLESTGPESANFNSSNGAVISAALAAGLYPQLAMRAPLQAKLETRGGRSLALHGGSVNAGVLRTVARIEADAKRADEDEDEGHAGRRRHGGGGGAFGLSGPAAAIAAAGSRGGVQWFAFEEVMQGGMGKTSVRDTTMVPAAALALLCGASGGNEDISMPDAAARCAGPAQLLECVAAATGIIAPSPDSEDDSGAAAASAARAPSSRWTLPPAVAKWPAAYQASLRHLAGTAASRHSAWLGSPPVPASRSDARAAASEAAAATTASDASRQFSTNESVRSAVLGPCASMPASLGGGLVLLRVDGWIGLAVPSALAPALAALRLRLRRAMQALVLAPFVRRLGGKGHALSEAELSAHTDAVATACDMLSIEVLGEVATSASLTGKRKMLHQDSRDSGAVPSGSSARAPTAGAITVAGLPAAKPLAKKRKKPLLTPSMLKRGGSATATAGRPKA
ncbi:hypothetical protein FNF29_01078 [Cafeteria roenbergensis]|uniref:RNA helicase n=1 Tax=Cafeteria roenbergensis TaxID=33653 RepID=A0A5A8CT30_CAFRO|nr:hypothetical protein FNF29_01078 [Cafeteria roenbergensis]|eukprot:KAA0156285.1 hypothetical protein FNF29_01078 [Cafeteria roenbergensis]